MVSSRDTFFELSSSMVRSPEASLYEVQASRLLEDAVRDFESHKRIQGLRKMER